MGILSKSSLSKDIKEASKTLGYLARAEKYFDLELIKNGVITKPLLKISDYIDPLRRISESAAQCEKGNVPDASAKVAFAKVDEISELCADILSVNPRGLTASDRTILSKLDKRLAEAKMLYNAARAHFNEEPVLVQKKPTAVAKSVVERPYEPAPEVQLQPKPVKKAVIEAPKPAPIVVEEEEDDYTPQTATAPTSAYSTSFQTAKAEVTYDFQNLEFEVEKPQEIERPKVVAINKTKKEKATDKPLFKEKYFATSYAGMNLQEAAYIIEELGRNPENLELVMLEHSSEVRPVELGLEIANDLRALAILADNFENGTEVEDKRRLLLLKDCERFITIVRDIASLTMQGFDNRKQKLFDKFIPHDLANLVEFAKEAYPEVFSTADLSGDQVAPFLYMFADVVQNHASHLDDEIFTSALAQVIIQVAQYAEFNSLKFKFDVLSKKNKISAKTRKVESRLEKAYLKAVTFTPQIARQAQEIKLGLKLSLEEEDIIKRGLELLHLTYLHARENYSEEIREFLKAA